MRLHETEKSVKQRTLSKGQNNSPQNRKRSSPKQLLSKELEIYLSGRAHGFVLDLQGPMFNLQCHKNKINDSNNLMGFAFCLLTKMENQSLPYPEVSNVLSPSVVCQQVVLIKQQ